MQLLFETFIIKFIQEVLPQAYEEALKEVSARKGVSFDELRESKPLLLFYAVPRVFAAPAKVGNDRVSEKGARFQVRTATRKHDTEEMTLLSGVRIREGNGIETVSLKWEAVDEYSDDVLKEQKINLRRSAPLGPVDNALIVVDEKMDQSDVTGIQKMLSKEGKLAAKKTYFVLGTGF